MINKPDFCKESAKIVKNIIGKPNHCIYINDAIAMLFDYMVYDFDGNYYFSIINFFFNWAISKIFLY